MDQVGDCIEMAATQQEIPDPIVLLHVYASLRQHY